MAQSLNLKALISKSIQIHDGPPAVYQLKPKKETIEIKDNQKTNEPKKETIGTLTKLTFGEKDETKLNKTILLVGETGSGKSTLINALVNYAVGVKFEDEVWFQIVKDEKRSQTESQTSDVIVYEIFGFEGQTLPFSLTIIDTPGFGDTRGIEKDRLVSQRLCDLFESEDGIHEINAIGLVMKASDNRLSDRLKYAFNSVMSLFEKDLEKSIIALITHSDGITPENVLQVLKGADIKCDNDKNDQPVHFMFNNQQNKQRNTSEKILKTYWELTDEQMGHFRNYLQKTKPHLLIRTVEVMNTRKSLVACIQNLQKKIELLEKYNRYEEEIKKYENFTYEYDEDYKDTQPVKSGWHGIYYEGTMICSDCEENCHLGCTNAWYPRDCKIFKWGHCTICTNKCHLSAHSKVTWKYVTKTRKVKGINNDMKKKYDECKNKFEKELFPLADLKSKIAELTRELSLLLDQANNHIIKIEQITSKSNLMTLFDELRCVIEKMEEKGDKEYVKVPEKLTIRINKGRPQ